MNSARRKKMKFLLFLSAILAICTAARGTYRDESIVECPVRPGVSIHILSEGGVSETFRSLGYHKSAVLISPLTRLLIMNAEQHVTETMRHIYSETLRLYEILNVVYSSPCQLNHIRMLIEDDGYLETTRVLYSRLEKLRERFYKKTERSQRLGKDIDDSIALSSTDPHYYPYLYIFLEFKADFHFSRGEDEEAFNCLEKSYSLVKELENYAIASHLAGRIGVYHENHGDLDGAEKYMQESLEYAMLLRDNCYISRVLRFLAAMKMKQGYLTEAEKLYIQAGEYCDRSPGDLVCQISASLPLAAMYRSFGETDRAYALVEKIILETEVGMRKIGPFERDLTGSSFNYLRARALTLLAELERDRGEFAESIAAMEIATSMTEKGKDRNIHAAHLKTLGDSYAAAGRDVEAAKRYGKALAIAEKLKNRRMIAVTLTALARLDLFGGREGRAGKLLERSIAESRAGGDWLQTMESTYLLGRLRCSQGKMAAGRRLLNGAVRLYDRESGERTFAPDRRAGNAMIDSVYYALLSIESEEDSAIDSLHFWAERSRHRFECNTLCAGAVLDGLIREILSDRRWIPDGTVLIQHVVTPGRLIILTADVTGLSRVSLPVDESSLAGKIDRFIRVSSGTGRSTEAEYASRIIGESSIDLGEILLGPVSGKIRESETIVFIPDGTLGYLPFSSLILPGGDHAYLGTEKKILTAGSLLSLSTPFRTSSQTPLDVRGAQFRNPLVVGGIDIPPLIGVLYPGLDDLPPPDKEIESLKALLGGCAILSGSEATRDKFVSMAPGKDLIYISTHAVRFPVYGYETALVLSSPYPIVGEKDLPAALLTAEDIRKVDLSGVKLVLLSSCESARGKMRFSSSTADCSLAEPEGSGLAGAFFDAGASAVIASLWPVEDSAAVAFATAFFGQLGSSGGDPAEAMRRTRAEIIARYAEAAGRDPAVGGWATFVLTASIVAAPGIPGF